MSCVQCIREKRVDNTLTCPPLQSPNGYITGPENFMQKEFVPKQPPAGSFDNLVTAMGVSSRYLFA